MPKRRKRSWAGGSIVNGVYWIDRYIGRSRCRFSTKCRTEGGALDVLARLEQGGESAARKVLGSGEETDFGDAVDAYLKHSGATNSAKHVRSQGAAFDRWARFLLLHGVRGLHGMAARHATEFIAWRKAGGASNPPRVVGEAAVNRDLAAMMALYTWHRETERIPEEVHPFKRVHLLKEHHDVNPHRVVDREHVMSVVEWFRRPELAWGDMPKWSDAILVLYGTAFRWGSFQRLNLGCIDERAGVLRDPKPKGKKAVEVGASGIVMEAAKRAVGRRYPDDEAQQLGRRLRIACAALGIPRFTAHDLRVSAATYMHEQGTSLRDLQHLLGHASLRTTERYVRASSRQARGPV